MSTIQKYINTIYEYLPPNNITEVTLWYLVHVDLIYPYINSIRHHNPGGYNIKNDVSLSCMKIIDPATGWFEIVKVSMFGLDEVVASNDEYI